MSGKWGCLWVMTAMGIELPVYGILSSGKMVLIYENLQHAIKYCPARRSCNNPMKSIVPM
jgi:hypothetical protein